MAAPFADDRPPFAGKSWARAARVRTIALEVAAMNDDRQAAPQTQLYAGVLAIVMGLVFLLARWDVFPFELRVHLLPVGLLVLGVLHVVRTQRLAGGLWFVLAGVLTWLHLAHVVSLRQSWPVFIIAAGLSMMAGALRGKAIGNGAR
jgi:hypothetical protein